MKTKSKQLNTIVSFVLLIVAVLSSISVSYSYFTSKASKSGDLTMGQLDVSFIYQAVGSMPSVINETSLVLASATETIEVGTDFQLSLWDSGQEKFININYIQIENGATSCDCYVRFWIDAYVMRGIYPDKSINYGKYFALKEKGLMTGNDFVRAGASQDYCYFIKLALGSGENLSLGNTMVLKDITNGTEVETVPAEILGEDVQISISFQAVQKANGAFKDVFETTPADRKGYYSDWE